VKRKWNWRLWVGFLLVLIGLLSFVPVFAQFPVTRDFPWVNLSLFAIGGVLLVIGLARAYRRPEAYRGKVSGPILTLLSVLGIAFFCYGIFYHARQLPASAQAPRAGQKAPDFSLPDQNGKTVALADLVSSGKSALLIFYRGYW